MGAIHAGSSQLGPHDLNLRTLGQGGVGWRRNALHLIVVMTDTNNHCIFEPGKPIPTSFVSKGGIRVPTAGFMYGYRGQTFINGQFSYVLPWRVQRIGYPGSRNFSTADMQRIFGPEFGTNNTGTSDDDEFTVPPGGATLQATIEGLHSLDAKVIGIASYPSYIREEDRYYTRHPLRLLERPNGDPAQGLSAWAYVTDAVDADGRPMVFDLTNQYGTEDYDEDKDSFGPHYKLVDNLMGAVDTLQTSSDQPIDIAMLLDDTGSFQGDSEDSQAAFLAFIDALRDDQRDILVAVARYEDFGGDLVAPALDGKGPLYFADDAAEGRPFILQRRLRRVGAAGTDKPAVRYLNTMGRSAVSARLFHIVTEPPIDPDTALQAPHGTQPFYRDGTVAPQSYTDNFNRTDEALTGSGKNWVGPTAYRISGNVVTLTAANGSAPALYSKEMTRPTLKADISGAASGRSAGVAWNFDAAGLNGYTAFRGQSGQWFIERYTNGSRTLTNVGTTVSGLLKVRLEVTATGAKLYSDAGGVLVETTDVTHQGKYHGILITSSQTITNPTVDNFEIYETAGTTAKVAYDFYYRHDFSFVSGAGWALSGPLGRTGQATIAPSDVALPAAPPEPVVISNTASSWAMPTRRVHATFTGSETADSAIETYQLADAWSTTNGVQYYYMEVLQNIQFPNTRPADADLGTLRIEVQITGTGKHLVQPYYFNTTDPMPGNEAQYCQAGDVLLFYISDLAWTLRIVSAQGSSVTGLRVQRAWDASIERDILGDEDFVALTTSVRTSTEGFGGDTPEALVEALYQICTGEGFDGNLNGNTTDSGVAEVQGLSGTPNTFNKQGTGWADPGNSGDVPAFADRSRALMPGRLEDRRTAFDPSKRSR